MRTFTTKHTVYKFDELNQEAREHAIETFIANDDMPFLEDYMKDELERLFEQYHITSDNAELRYSLSCSQGDGASFTGDIEWGAWRASIGTNYYGNWYMHSKSVGIDEMTSIKTDKDAPESVQAKLASIIERIGDDLEESGYQYIDDCRDADSVAENIRANEYEFTEDGEIV